MPLEVAGFKIWIECDHNPLPEFEAKHVEGGGNGQTPACSAWIPSVASKPFSVCIRLPAQPRLHNYAVKVIVDGGPGRSVVQRCIPVTEPGLGDVRYIWGVETGLYVRFMDPFRFAEVVPKAPGEGSRFALSHERKPVEGLGQITVQIFSWERTREPQIPPPRLQGLMDVLLGRRVSEDIDDNTLFGGDGTQEEIGRAVFAYHTMESLIAHRIAPLPVG
ncbi:hypothetical protein DFP72DRAFT_896772 [Ephemerocybe angulata]|uniref:DUF7918 domain-containing protein n=1 Tax=Ephemerocybe angulata TaxID=980116 RepID=A0A8H6HYS5_9AGAR|nr:hypothetical protein DFP72DRAFT_896772 [Tulosesus angulatus]